MKPVVSLFRIRRIVAAALVLLASTTTLATDSAARAQCVVSTDSGTSAPVLADPYPLMAAGWGPELGGGIMASR